MYEDYGLHCHLVGAHSIHKHLILILHLAEILGGRPFLIIVSFHYGRKGVFTGMNL
jgi:hypothetical protein